MSEPYTPSQGKHCDDLNVIGTIKFTPREIDVLAFTISGRTAKKMAALLDISPRTVENHVRNIMFKLECNSREAIIDFAERSGKLLYLKQRYVNLIIHAAFQKALNRICTLPKPEESTWKLIDDSVQSDSHSFLTLLKQSFEKAGLSLKAIPLDAVTSFPISNVIIFATEEQSRDLLTYLGNLKQTRATTEANPILVVQSYGQKSIPSAFLQLFDPLRVTSDPTCKLVVLKLLVRALHNQQAEIILENFQNDTEAVLSSVGTISRSHTSASPENPASAAHTFTQMVLDYPLRIFSIASIVLCSIIALIFFTLTLESTQQKNPQYIRSDLPVPAKATMLSRQDVLQQIIDKFNVTSGIQKVAIIGIGGSGKTTIARYYARAQTVSVVWELSAHDRASLVQSFEHLAEALAHTGKEKNLLRQILRTKSQTLRATQLISFVQERMRTRPNWILIYDNVEKFTDLKNYFPHDKVLWGQGQVLLTSQDQNLPNNTYVDDAIHIGKLNAQEKLNLFNKIMTNGKTLKQMPYDVKEAQEFLTHIPPFPLDISTAAYYIKSTKTSFKRYLEHLRNYNTEFVQTQAEILKEASDYARTRYSIITLSLKRLIETNKDFADLLLLVSVLGSQNIPKSLLDSFKDKATVDNFIYQGNRFSQFLGITSYQDVPVISMQRSSQAICLSYLKSIFNLKENPAQLISIAKMLGNYTVSALDEEDFKTMKLLLPHCEALLNQRDLISSSIQSSVSGNLGCIHYYLRHSLEAKELLEASLHLAQNETNASPQKGRVLMYLGNVHKLIGNYEIARQYLKQGHAFYEENKGNFSGHARAKGYLGTFYRDTGNYTKAIRLLEGSLKIYETHLSSKIGHAWSLRHLGATYIILGDYSKAQLYLEESLKIYQKHGNDYVGVAWVLGYLGEVARKLGDLQKAKQYHEQGLAIYNKYFLKNHIFVATSLVFLGDVYNDLGQHAKAQEILQQCLLVYQAYYGNNSLKAAQIEHRLGIVALNSGNFMKAEQLFKKALSLFEKHQAPEQYNALESLATLYLKLAQTETTKGQAQEAHAHQAFADKLLLKALHVAKTYFPKGSPHIVRLQNKLMHI